MNVTFGSGINTLAQGNPQNSEPRVSIAAPAQADEQDTTSFVPVDEASESANARQDDARQGIEAREAENEVRAKKALRRDERDAIEDAQRERRLDDRTEDRRIEERRAQERAEQAQQAAELRQIRDLAERDREVRAHEQAHQAVGGQYAGSASYEYQRGPDGKQYAVGGEVPIRLSSDPNNPEATLEQAETVRRAALAPAEPSSQDRRVAAQATQIALEAQAQIQALQREEQLAKEDEVEEDTTAKSVSDEERKDEKEDTQRNLLAEEEDTSVIGDLQEINDRLSRIQAELQEISQFDDRVKASTNLLDATV